MQNLVSSTLKLINLVFVWLSMDRSLARPVGRPAGLIWRRCTTLPFSCGTRGVVRFFRRKITAISAQYRLVIDDLIPHAIIPHAQTWRTRAAAQHHLFYLCTAPTHDRWWMIDDNHPERKKNERRMRAASQHHLFYLHYAVCFVIVVPDVCCVVFRLMQMNEYRRINGIYIWQQY